MKSISVLFSFALGATAQSQVFLGAVQPGLTSLQGDRCGSDRCGIYGGASPCTEPNRLIKQIPTATVARHCAPLCRAEAACKSYAAGPGGCWLYSDDVHNCEGVSGNAGWSFNARDCYPSKSDDSCDQNAGQSPCSFNGNFIKRIPSGTTSQTCGLLCREEPSCKSYAAGYGECWLYSADIETCKGASGGSGWSYSNRECSSASSENSCGRLGGASVCTEPTRLIKQDTTANTDRACAPKCRAEPNCKSYAAGLGGCYLYSADVNECEGLSGQIGWLYSDRNCYPSS